MRARAARASSRRGGPELSDERVYVLHARSAIDRALRYAEPGRDAFFGDPMIQDAVLRNLEIVDEAVKHVSPALRQQAPEVPWREMAGLRDRLVHDHFDVDLALAWHVVEDELPQARAQIDALLAMSGLGVGAEAGAAAAMASGHAWRRRVAARWTARMRRAVLSAALLAMILADLALVALAVIIIVGNVLLGALGHAGLLVLAAIMVLFALVFLLAGGCCWVTVLVWRTLQRTLPSAA